MANARIIRQNFFNAPTIANYSIDEKYLIIGMACTADDYGRLWKYASNIKSIIFPTDKEITDQWISRTINKLIKNGVLCEYEEDKIRYIHFPKWFEKGWYLKQRIDHPKEFGGCPDCPTCKTEEITRKVRETSCAIKDNIIQPNQIKDNTNKSNKNYMKLISELSSRRFIEQSHEKYPLITNDRYTEQLDKYIQEVDTDDGWDKDHQVEFDKQLQQQHEWLCPGRYD